MRCQDPSHRQTAKSVEPAGIFARDLIERARPHEGFGQRIPLRFAVRLDRIGTSGRDRVLERPASSGPRAGGTPLGGRTGRRVAPRSSGAAAVSIADSARSARRRARGSRRALARCVARVAARGRRFSARAVRCAAAPARARPRRFERAFGPDPPRHERRRARPSPRPRPPRRARRTCAATDHWLAMGRGKRAAAIGPWVTISFQPGSTQPMPFHGSVDRSL